MRINQVETLVGISKKNIRFYEEEGLLHPVRNSENGYREYGEADVEVLKQIKFFRKLSIPIEEIRRMQTKHQTLSDCMERHLIVLSREEKNLENVKQICKTILENKEQLDLIQVNDYLAEMEELEKNGVRFKDVRSEDRKKKQMTASLMAGIIMIFLALITVVVSIWLPFLEPEVPIPVIICLIALPLFVIVGIVLALRLRMKEIQGGELDEASNY